MNNTIRLQSGLYEWMRQGQFTPIEEHGFLTPASYSDPDQIARMRWVREQLKGSVLDVGTGIGELLREYSGDAVGIDMYRRHIVHAQLTARPNHRFYCIDIVFGLPFNDKQFETIVMAEVLEHMRFSDAVFVLRDAIRCCSSRIILTFPNMHDGDYNIGDVESGEHRWSTAMPMFERLIASVSISRTQYVELCNRRFMGIVLCLA